jgi:purine-binding chemotaxis protein CheW
MPTTPARWRRATGDGEETLMQYCTFTLDTMTLGVEVGRVQEAIRYQPMTAVPLAARVVGGLLNLRGQIVTAIELRRCFELDDRDPEERPMNVVVRTGDGVVSLLVDRIGDVVDADDDAFEAIPDTVTGAARHLVTGAYKLPGGLLLALDADRAAATTTGAAS